jgi:SAM-dependent methyltransferase
MAAIYDTIGRTYTSRRQPDARIAAAIEHALAGCGSILNVGAGTGSYEPRAARVVAIEPSRTMIAQRPVHAAPAVQARAEALPFSDQSFDAVLGVLTVHHWMDQTKGLAECRRVARSRIVLLTVDIDICAGFWLFEYFPQLLEADRPLFSPIQRFEEVFGPVEVTPVPIPADCRDGFLSAYWKRPSAYLDPLVRACISTFAKIGDLSPGLARLKVDTDSGVWARRYSALKNLPQLDLGYRLVVAHLQARH